MYVLCGRERRLRSRKKWKRKDYRIARARAQPPNTHTASYGSRRTRSLQALKHTHPAGLLFQSNLLVDAARTFTKFFLASHNSPIVSTYCHADRSKSALLIDLCRRCCCFLVARGTKSKQKFWNRWKIENSAVLFLLIMTVQVGFNSALSGFTQDLLNV